MLKVATAISFTRSLTTRLIQYNVAVCGACGSIGQPLSLFLKLNPLVHQISLYDVTATKGVTTDLSHISTKIHVKGFDGRSKLRDALKNMDVVMICSGSHKDQSVARDDIFEANAEIVTELAEAIVEVCPKAMIGVMTYPINSTVPIVCEVFKKYNKLDPNRIFGVTALDNVRANTIVAKAKSLNVDNISVPVIGGNTSKTIIPLLSKIKGKLKLSAEELVTLTKQIQNASNEVAEAGSASLSMAYAAAKFTCAILKGLKGETDFREFAYVMSNLTEAPYFSSSLTLGKNGVENIMNMEGISEYEQELLKNALPELKMDIQKGVAFVRKYYDKDAKLKQKYN